MTTLAISYTTIPSPIGDLRLVGSDTGLRGVFMTPHRHDPGLGEGWVEDAAPLADAAAQLGEYFAGERTAFELPLEPEGTPFQLAVWERLRAIGYGETTSYGAIARELGLGAHGSRAVGLANGRNPISIVVPCHRVIGSDGSLVGYGGGLERKRALLAHEAEVKAGFRTTLW
jgi:methylated-DNA-[protein]-cysteine S-methyltransferase